jgi:hypothetical protein
MSATDEEGLLPKGPGGDDMKISGRRIALATLLLAALLWASPVPVNATLLDVSVDTSALAGQSAILAFDFIDGDAAAGEVGVANNMATISGFSLSGGALQGDGEPIGDVSGTLDPGPLMLMDSYSFNGDTYSFNEFLQPVVLGGLFKFTVVVTENFVDTPATIPDQFSLWLLDENFVPFPTDAPNEWNLLAVAGADRTAALYSLQVQAIPEPSTLTLLAVGALGLLGRRARRRPVLIR